MALAYQIGPPTQTHQSKRSSPASSPGFPSWLERGVRGVVGLSKTIKPQPRAPGYEHERLVADTILF